MRHTLLVLAWGLPLWLVACAPEEDLASGRGPAPQSAARVAAGPVVAAFPTLDTYIPETIQIDYDASSPPGDANLFTGNDPADGTASFDLPAGATSYIDWDDLSDESDEYRYLDLEGLRGRDYSAFPRSNSCVGPAHVLSKMDLTYVAVANNTDHAFFAVQRSDNNGDAGYYWLITRDPPTLGATSGCRATETELAFDLSGPDAAAGTEGDLMLAGHFVESDVPLLTVYRAVGDTVGTLAVDALDFEDASLWSEVTIDHPVAVNETTTRAGGFGASGVDASDGTDVEPEIFAEAAVAVDALQGTDICDGHFYGTVITRSSGSGGTSPDLKDLAGPFVLNFRPVTATAHLEPLCGGEVWYEAEPTDEDIEVTCDWTFDDGTTVTDSCSGSVTVTPGTRYATVVVTAANTPCTDEVVTDAVEVGAELAVTAELAGSCDETVVYASEVTGAIGALDYDWVFTDAAGNEVGSATAPDGSLWVGDGAIHASLFVSDDRGDGLVCTAETTADAEVMPDLVVTADLVGTCEETVAYAAVATGGDGDYAYTWTFDDGFTDTSASGTRSLGAQPAGGTWVAAEVAVSWVAEDGTTCEDTAGDGAWVYSPITVHLTPDGRGGECPTSDAVTWTAVVTGGGPDVTYDWTVDTCDGAPTCTIDPAATDVCVTEDVQLTVRDPDACDDVASEVEQYVKYTVVTATDN